MPARGETTSVNKLKSMIRQTKRLLAKESIEPGTRIEAERRLRAMELELEESMQSNKERHFATRYHKVKFFERQKLMRRLRQLRREPESRQVRAQLFEHRVFLNYVLHFPADRRYVSLFAGNKEPVAPSADAPDRAHQKAAEFFKHVRKSMKRGTMAAEPDRDLHHREEQHRRTRAQHVKRSEVEEVDGDGDGDDDGDDDDDEHDDEADDDDDDDGDDDDDDGGDDDDDDGDDDDGDDEEMHDRADPPPSSVANDDFFA